MTAAVQHCTTAPRHVITLSTPRQPAQLLGAASPHMHAAAAATESAEWWPALSSHQPGVAWCRDGHTAGCRISPTAAVQLSPVLGCATRTAGSIHCSTAALQPAGHLISCSRPVKEASIRDRGVFKAPQHGDNDCCCTFHTIK